MDSELTLPAIVIADIDDSLPLWEEVWLGIEEEGIPVLPRRAPSQDVIACAWQSAEQSPLLVGIACDRQRLVVHYKNLPASAPLFVLTSLQDTQQKRHTGNNAARLVKGIPFREGQS